MILFFSIALVVLLSSGIFSSEEYKIALLSKDDNIESIEVLSIIDVSEDRYVMVESLDDGLELVRFQKVAFFVVVNNETDPETIGTNKPNRFRVINERVFKNATSLKYF